MSCFFLSPDIDVLRTFQTQAYVMQRGATLLLYPVIPKIFATNQQNTNDINQFVFFCFLSLSLSLDMDVLRTFQTQACVMQRDAIWWLHTVVPKMFATNQQEFTSW